MPRAFSLGRVVGIRLDVHASWFVLYVLFAWTLASDAPIAALGRIDALAIGAAGALGLFACVLAHEFGHALVARAFGIGTRSIALVLFGGVATLEREPARPGVDALIALAGPVVSALLAVLAYSLLHVVDRIVPAGASDAAAAIVAYAIWVNAMLALFNLIPAYPMDGGRLLRAALWSLRGDRDRATVNASLVGIVLATAAGLAGLVAVVVTRAWPFAWYVSVAVFIAGQSWDAYRELRPRRSVASTPPLPLPLPPAGALPV
jgi:Zn-dependent protease